MPTTFFINLEKTTQPEPEIMTDRAQLPHALAKAIKHLSLFPPPSKVNKNVATTFCQPAVIINLCLLKYGRGGGGRRGTILATAYTYIIFPGCQI